MSKYSDLISTLRDCNDQSDKDLQIVSLTLRESIGVLKKYNIDYEDLKEGLSIDISNQPIKIYKTKQNAVKYLCESDFSSDIIIIEADAKSQETPNIEYLAEHDACSCSNLFENIKYYFIFKKLLLDRGIAAYNDEALNRMILLSSNHGRLHVAYDNGWVDEFYDCKNDLERQHKTLLEKININNDYEGFFKESLIEYAKTIPDESLRYVKSLQNMSHIIESSDRNFELFKHNFSFREFKKQLDEDKEKYLKDYQSGLSDFLSKVASMPIQFGVYIYLMVRFSGELLPIVATIILIVFWSGFKVITINRIIENIEYLRSMFQSDLDMLLVKSGIGEGEVKTDRNLISQRFGRSIFLIKSYRIFVLVFSLCALAICSQFVMDILSK